MRFLAALPLVIPLGLPASSTHAQAQAQVGLADATPSSRAHLVEALELLHAWDARRARAWGDNDRAELRALYVPGSLAGRADVRLLDAYADRGVVVSRLVTQVFAVRVLRQDAHVVRLRVVDRVAGGAVVHAGHEVTLRSSTPVTRTVTLRVVRGGWLVEGVSGSGRGLREAPR